jgi:diguanylate cyclase (GGDEF)-like protein
MEDESAKKPTELARSDSKAIATSSASLVGRGLRSLAITEERTGLYNFRHIDFVLETEMYRSEQYGYEFALVFLEVDHFRDLISPLSTPGFNKLLAEMGQFVRSALRQIDFGFFYREGEFVLILPQAPKESVCMTARRLHRLFRETTWLTPDEESLRLTASIGVATYPTDAQTKIDLIHRAEEALYLVRSTTGDGVAVASLGMLPPME